MFNTDSPITTVKDDLLNRDKFWNGYNKLDRNFKVMYNQNIINKEHDHARIKQKTTSYIYS